MENKKEKEKVAAIVVTYNRKTLLIECLDAILSQSYPLDSIILIDNASNDGTFEFLQEKGYLSNPKIDYVRLIENTGGAGGFYKGMKIGYEKNFDYLWLMDDDTNPQKDALLELINSLKILNENKEKVGVIGSTPIGEIENLNLSWVLGFKKGKKVYKNLQDLKEEIEEVDSLPFISFFIKKNIIEEIGYPEKDFFIWGDDVEYCYRIKKSQRKIFISKKSIVYHPLALGVELSFFKKKIYLKSSIKSPWKDYYDARNYIFLIKKHNLSSKNYLKLLGFILLSVFKRDQKLKRIKFYFKGIIDGIFNKSGKRV